MIFLEADFFRYAKFFDVIHIYSFQNKNVPSQSLCSPSMFLECLGSSNVDAFQLLSPRWLDGLEQS